MTNAVDYAIKRITNLIGRVNLVAEES